MRTRLTFLTLTCCLVFGTSASASIISHSPGDRVPPVVVSGAFASLAAGGEVGANFVDFGVDYSFGNREGIFSDGGTLAFSGVNGSDVVDLLTSVDGRIVALGTTTQALTSFLYVEAGFAAEGSLTLSAFDSSGALIASTTNGPPLGANGRTTMTIDRSGVFDIARFTIGGNDTFGVNEVQIESPQSFGSAVPEPTSIIIFGLVMSAAGIAGRRRRLR